MTRGGLFGSGLGCALRIDGLPLGRIPQSGMTMYTDTPNELVEALRLFLRERRSDAHRVFHHFQALGRALLLRSDLLDGYQDLCAAPGGDRLLSTPLEQVIEMAQEAALDATCIHLALRRRIGRWFYLCVHLETMAVAEIGVAQFLAFKEALIGGNDADWTLEVDLQPFNRNFAMPSEDRFIGRGVEFLNRRLSSRLFEEQGLGQERMLQFLRLHAYKGRTLMLSEGVRSVGGLRRALRKAWRMGVDRPHIARIGRGRIVVKGHHDGHRAKVVFDRWSRRCEVIKVRGLWW